MATRSRRRPSRNRVDCPPGDYNRRVFIGGNYDFPANLREIKSIINKTGFTPILAEDFTMPREETRQYCLRLLHNCKYAVFEMSQPAGEMIEFDKCFEYGVRAMVFFQKFEVDQEPNQISSMQRTFFKFPFFGYSTIEELERHLTKLFPNVEDNIEQALQYIEQSALSSSGFRKEFRGLDWR